MLAIGLPGLTFAAATITVFDVPGAGTGPNQGTFATAINDLGTIAGYYLDGNNEKHGFLRTATGTFTTFDASGSAGTEPLSINDAGTIAGEWTSPLGVNLGFLRFATGRMTLFAVPGAGTGVGQGTAAVAINQSGTVTGPWFDAAGGRHGFVRSSLGLITKFDAPGSTSGTSPAGINGFGAIAGGANGSGFVRTPEGAITVFGPGAANSINLAGTAAGSVSEIHGGGYIRTSDGTVTEFSTGILTMMEHPSINDAGVVAGFLLAESVSQGFIRAADGNISVFQAPDSLGGSTFPFGINASSTITGYATDANAVHHGFFLVTT